MKGIFHLSLSIRGGLANAEALCGCITVDGKMLNTVPEVKNFLREQLDIGRECLRSVTATILTTKPVVKATLWRNDDGM